MDIKIHQPHDRFTKRILSEITVARDLIKTHLPPDIVKRIDWDSVQTTNSSFVTEELQQYHSDVVYQCTIDKKSAYIYTLIENQSTPDKLMAFRILSYNVALMEHHLRMDYKELPIIINICIYMGKESPYPYSQDVYDCFEDVSLARESMFKPFKLLDLSVRSQEELLADGTLGTVEALLKQGRERDYLNWINSNPLLICKLISSYGRSIAIYILGIDNKNEPQELLEAMIKVAPENKDIIMSAAHKLIQEGMQTGIQEGIQTGLIKGIKEGMQSRNLDIAKNMLQKGCDINFITEITGLSREAIEKLIKE